MIKIAQDLFSITVTVLIIIIWNIKIEKGSTDIKSNTNSYFIQTYLV